MPWLISHGPRSIPVRTSARGAGTRHAPWRQASHISSQEASKATDSPARTRSCGPMGSSCRKIRASASTNAAEDRCWTATPLGVPVEPEVKITQASSSGSGIRGSGNGCGRLPPVTISPSALQDGGHPGLTEHQPGTFVGVVGVHRDVRRPDQQDRQDGDVQLVGAGRDPDADLVAGARGRPGAAPAPWPGPRPSAGHSSATGGRRPGRRPPGYCAGRLLEDVDQRPLRRRGSGARQLGQVHGPDGRTRIGAGLRRGSRGLAVVQSRGDSFRTR